MLPLFLGCYWSDPFFFKWGLTLAHWTQVSDRCPLGYLFLRNCRLIEAKFYVNPPWDGGMKVFSNGPGHMTNMAAMPIYVTNLKTHLLWNQKADDIESWYAASGTRVLPNYAPWVTLTYFMARSNLVPYAFVWEKGKTMNFSETIVVCDIKVGRCSQLNVHMNLYEYQRSGSFTDLHRKSLRFNIFRLLFLRNRLANWSQILCGAAMGWGNESEYKCFLSHDQDDRHAHIW